MLAMPRVIAWRIHHVAYVENLKPLRQSNFSTACIRPRLPSWMRSSSGSPDAWYFLAIDTTRRRFDCTNWRSASSPWRAVRRSSRLRAGVTLLAAGVEVLDRLLARLDRLGQADLVVLGEQRVLPDVGQVEAYEVFVIAFNAILGHGGSFVPSRQGRCRRARHPRPGGDVAHDTDAVKPDQPERGSGPPVVTATRQVDADICVPSSALSPTVASAVTVVGQGRYP